MQQYITKPYKQRTSIVTSIPKEIRIALKLCKGDYLVWQVSQNSYFVQVSKVFSGGNGYERGAGNRAKGD